MDTPIFIEYETKSREFDGKLLLITNMLQAGYTNIFFGTNRYLRKLALKKQNGIYFFKSMSKNEESFYQRLKLNKHKLVILHAEGGVHYKDNESSIRSIFNPVVGRYFDYNFVFGDFIKSSIAKYEVGSNEQLVISSGDPRFDLLKHKYDPFFVDEINDLTRKHGDFMLINTSFSASNPQIGVENLRKYWQNEPTLTKQTIDSLMYKIDYFSAVVDHYLKAITVLASAFPDKKFIVRPHPSESLDVYLQHFGAYKNIHVTKEGNVAMWIKASKGVIHYDCTTGIEARIAGKPVIAYVPQADEKIVAWLPIAISKKITDIAELRVATQQVFSGEFKHELDSETAMVLEQTIHNVSFESAPIISQTLQKHHKDHYRDERTDHWIQDLLDQTRYDLKVKLRKFIYGLLKKNDVGSSKKGKFTKREIKRKLDSLYRIQNMTQDFQLKMLTTDCIRISKKSINTK